MHFRFLRNQLRGAWHGPDFGIKRLLAEKLDPLK
jgi:hypothetical protein